MFGNDAQTEQKIDVIPANDEGALEVVIAPAKNAAGGEAVEMALSADVLNNLTENRVEAVTLQGGTGSALEVRMDMQAVLEQMQAAGADSVVAEVAETKEIAPEVAAKIPAAYETKSGTCEVSIKLQTGDALAEADPAALNMTVTMKTEVTLNDPNHEIVGLFMNEDGEIVEIEAVWVVDENGENGHWELPFVGSGTYMLAERAKEAVAE